MYNCYRCRLEYHQTFVNAVLVSNNVYLLVLTSDAVGDLPVGSAVCVSSRQGVDDSQVTILRDTERIARSWSELRRVVVDVGHADGDGRHVVVQLVHHIHGEHVVVSGLSVQGCGESHGASLRVHGEPVVRYSTRHVEAQVPRPRACKREIVL